MTPVVRLLLTGCYLLAALGCEADVKPVADGSLVDASAVDASAVDASAVDASAVDASAVDASAVDASPLDSSIVDAAAVVDASTVDAAATDANPNLSGTLIEEYSAPGGGLVWTCPDGTAIALAADVSKRSTICLGIDGSECHEPGSDPGPEDAQCADPSFNAFKDTCVEAYFSCFQPAGSCTILANGNQLWGNGALQDRNVPNLLNAYVPPAQTQACITGTLGDGVVIYQR